MTAITRTATTIAMTSLRRRPAGEAAGGDGSFLRHIGVTRVAAAGAGIAWVAAVTWRA